MTNEEISQFQDKINETIIPVAINMKDIDIKELIEHIEKENPDLPEGFGNMLYEQVIMLKYKNKVV